ncbi:MAG: hypothetical protein MZV65_22380 [Chromatiales bacterium]|nr:hypothetical protein [Chromatiales bacterium]
MTKVLERYEIELPWLEPWLRPPPRFSDVALDGRRRSMHPRILLPELAGWNGRGLAPPVRTRQERYAAVGLDPGRYPPCGGSGVLRLAVCWILTGDEEAGRRGLEALSTFEPSPPGDYGDYGNGWELAWAYDWLALHPDLPDSTRRRVRSQLAALLPSYLEQLDGRGPSLWHGRATLAATAWLIAVALDAETPEQQELIRRAQVHFREAMAALRLSEGWPEGYNYWINSRAFMLTLAAGAYLNGFEDTQAAPEMRQALERVGLWTLYMTRPDGRVELTGDEGPRVDLKDETRRVIDLIVQLTRSRVLSTYSRWLEARHGVESYYRDYRWGFQLFNDPTVLPLAPVSLGTLDGLKAVLPSADWFGPKAFNQIVARSGWGADDTLLTLRAGHSFTHHGHYDAGHFTLFKGTPLAISNATYRGDIAAPNRLYYGIRTVSRNSLLVLRPNERIRPSRLVERNVIDGGQRIVMPTRKLGARRRGLAGPDRPGAALRRGRSVPISSSTDGCCTSRRISPGPMTTATTTPKTEAARCSRSRARCSIYSMRIVSSCSTRSNRPIPVTQRSGCCTCRNGRISLICASSWGVRTRASWKVRLNACRWSMDAAGWIWCGWRPRRR